MTDGAARREMMLISTERTFNDSFCQNYFCNDIVIESYKKYIDVVFATKVPEKLIDKFNFNCCRNEIHNEVCYEKWDELKKYLVTGMLEELGVLKKLDETIPKSGNSSIDAYAMLYFAQNSCT